MSDKLSPPPSGHGFSGSNNRRVLHNAFEKNRRDTIRGGYLGLVDVVPTLNEKQSRSKILKTTINYIHELQEVEHLSREIESEEAKNRLLIQERDKIKLLTS
eukprot:Sdes_comp9300_c0_seq1m787